MGPALPDLQGYLWHVIHERDHLAAHTIFLQ